MLLPHDEICSETPYAKHDVVNDYIYRQLSSFRFCKERNIRADIVGAIHDSDGSDLEDTLEPIGSCQLLIQRLLLILILAKDITQNPPHTQQYWQQTEKSNWFGRNE